MILEPAQSNTPCK